MKKFLCAFLAAVTAAATAMCGCSFANSKAGRDGRDLDIYEIYEAANTERGKEGLPSLSFSEFLKEYLAGIDVSTSDDVNIRASVNRSLLSCVAVLSGFSYRRGLYSDTAWFAGSGVMVEADKTTGEAYILTNCHVVYCDVTDGTTVADDRIDNAAYAKSVYVSFYGDDDLNIQNDFPAEIVASSETYDLALLKITSPLIVSGDFRAAEFCEGEEVYVGERVYAVGNPEGDGFSVTEGIISRESEVIELSPLSGGQDISYRVIRTDAAINGGNSGGGLFDASGRLLGIVNSKMTGEEVDNMGYVLAGSYCKRLWKLFADGYGAAGEPGVTRAVFNVPVTVSSDTRYDTALSVTKITDTVTVSMTYGGFMAGDVIERIKITDASGGTVEDMEILRSFNIDDALLSAREGYFVEYTVKRSGNSITVRTSPEMEQCK